MHPEDVKTCLFKAEDGNSEQENLFTFFPSDWGGPGRQEKPTFSHAGKSSSEHDGVSVSVFILWCSFNLFFTVLPGGLRIKTTCLTLYWSLSCPSNSSDRVRTWTGDLWARPVVPPGRKQDPGSLEAGSKRHSCSLKNSHAENTADFLTYIMCLSNMIMEEINWKLLDWQSSASLVFQQAQWCCVLLWDFSAADFSELRHHQLLLSRVINCTLISDLKLLVRHINHTSSCVEETTKRFF